ncbi:hypothetical protein TB1_030559 [Malus domestica]
MSPETFRGLRKIRLINDPGPASTVLNIGSIVTSHTRFFVAIKGFRADFAPDFLVLFFRMNHSPFLALVTLRSIYINRTFRYIWFLSRESEWV